MVKRTSAVMSISQKARQLSFIITALNKNFFLSEAMITNILAALGLSPSDPTIQLVAELKWWNRTAQGTLTPQYKVTLGEDVKLPFPFVQALSKGQNVALAGNNGVVEKAVWHVTGGRQVTLTIDVAHLQFAGSMTKILEAVGTEKYVFEEAIASSLSAKWVEMGGQRTAVLGKHLEAACKDNSKNGAWAALQWMDIGLPHQRGRLRLVATVYSTEVAEDMLQMPLMFAVIL